MKKITLNKKKCRVCGKTRALAYYKASARSNDGYEHKCLVCKGNMVDHNIGFTGRTHTEAARRKIGKVAKGRKPYNKGKHGLHTHTDETRAAISAKLKAAWARRRAAGTDKRTPKAKPLKVRKVKASGKKKK